jgi:hypothetical protein
MSYSPPIGHFNLAKIGHYYFAVTEFYAQIKVYENPSKIVPTGLNILIHNSRGEILIRVDGHTIIQRDYVRNCVELLLHSKADNVGGRMNTIGESNFEQVVAYVTSSPFGVGGARFHYSDREEYVDTVYMGAWKRDIFKKLGLFDEEMVRNQDDEFNYRLREFGGKVLLSPKIKSYYYPRGSITKLWKQYFQYGFFKVRVLQKHPAQMRPRQFIPFAFVMAILIGLLLTIFTPWGWIPLALLTVIYLFANLAASMMVAVKSGWRFLPMLPPAFATLHVSYGLGFLFGLIKFRNRWRDKTGRVPKGTNA